jgi:hypothetical protein
MTAARMNMNMNMKMLTTATLLATLGASVALAQDHASPAESNA